MIRSEFRVMGSAAHIVCVGGSGRLAARLEERLAFLESRWSRFIPTSDISRLNSSGGRPVEVDPSTVLLVLRSIDGWRITGGRFDPTILRSMVDAGYGPAIGTDEVEHQGCDGIEVDSVAGTVRFPIGLALDPGGIGKGLAADLVAAEAMNSGARGVLVNVGGDLRAMGEAPTSEGWTVGVESPFDATETLAIPRLADGGVATSTPIHRRWTVDGQPAVHIIDPRTRRPVATDVASVTVIASEGWMAEVASKAALAQGFDAVIDYLDSFELSGFAVATDGRMALAPRLGVFL